MRLLAQTLVGLLALVAAGPTPSSRPVVSGTFQVGNKLTASPGRWSSVHVVTYAYQWYRCTAVGTRCSAIRGATSGSYRTVPKDAGRTLGLTVRGSDSSGVTSSYSALVGVIAPRTAPTAPAGQPTLSGEAIVGRTLTVATPLWTAGGADPTYAWRRCNANGRVCGRIAGASETSYTLTPADAGRVVVATATAEGSTVFSQSAGVTRPRPGPLATGLPAIAGTLQRGAKLTASAGSWTGSGTITYTYQWYRCDGVGAHCSAIRGARRGTYTQVAADVGHTLGLTVHATDATGTTVAYAPLAGTIAGTGDLAASAQPTVTGAATVAATLKVGQGAWTTTPSSFAYGWLRCNSNGRLCTAIAGATADSYTVTADDAGHTLVATVTATAGTSVVPVLAVASPVVGS
jgi:Ig domain of plant-specific actin-binding protein